MPEIKTSIIPDKQTLATLKESSDELDLEAICAFVALGFFLDDTTFWKNKKVLRAGTVNQLDDEGYLLSSSKYFDWSYEPDEKLTFDDAVNAFEALFENIIDRQVGDRKVILPLSGGLDSRTQAVALKALDKNVSSYSYAFENGYPEHKIGKKIAKHCNFEFKDFTIKPGYLWTSIEDLAKINACYSEFTHPRQMAIVDQFATLGEVFSLGHWGDVLFDDMGVPDNLDFQSQIEVLKKKIIKPSGLLLAEKLWEYFQLQGDFKTYLHERIATLLKTIAITNSANANIRAFKSVYWAPRWTSINLSIFESIKPITVPYYHNEMCQFICKVPERFLANRAIQIEYIKRKNPKLASIVWHQQKPFNLNTYKYNKSPYNLPYRVVSKLNRVGKEMLKKSLVQRNWELQFLGESNQNKLNHYLFKGGFLPKSMVQEVLNDFNTKDRVFHAHALSMVLTLSLWDNVFND